MKSCNLRELPEYVFKETEKGRETAELAFSSRLAFLSGMRFTNLEIRGFATVTHMLVLQHLVV